MTSQYRVVRIGLSATLSLMLLGACAKNGADGTSPSQQQRGDQTSQKPSNPVPVPPSPTTPPSDKPSPGHQYASLSWESTDSSDRKNWSAAVFKYIEQEFSALDRVDDAAAFCPRYSKMTHDQRVSFWGMLISEISRLESDWNPIARMREPGMGTDPITHEHVYSEGLMQMSYQDTLGNPGCKFNWVADKSLSPTSPKKTILNPYRNLNCGVLVMAKQINEHHEIALAFGEYWSTIRKGSADVKKVEEGVKEHLSSCRLKAEPELALKE